MRVLFVCSGNICRSPTAEGVMRHLAAQRGADVEVDSAGTGGWHAGEAPDTRSVATAARRGIAIEGAARQVRSADFDAFDLLVAMDRGHERDLLSLAPDAQARDKVRLLVEATDVPDPYYGGGEGFEEVLDLVLAGCLALLDELAPPR